MLNIEESIHSKTKQTTKKKKRYALITKQRENKSYKEMKYELN